MPACVVEGCSPGSRGADSGAILHVFPKDKDMIRKWLLATGQQFEDLEDFISRIYKGKISDTYRMCSKHFSPESYMYKPQSKKRKLTPNAVPSIFTKPTDPKEPSPEGLPPSKIRRKNIDTFSGHLKPGDRCPTCSQLIPHGLSLPPSEDIAEKLVTQGNKATVLNPTYGTPNQYGQENGQSFSVKIVKIGIIPHGSSLQPDAGMTETLVDQDGNATAFYPSYRTTNQYVQETVQGFIKMKQPDELVPHITLKSGESITVKSVEQDGNATATVLNPAYRTTNQCVGETVQGFTIKTEQPDESENVTIKTEQLDNLIPLSHALQSTGDTTEKSVEQDGKATVYNPTYRTTNQYVQETVQGFTIKTEELDNLVPASTSLQSTGGIMEKLVVGQDGIATVLNPAYRTTNQYVQETVQGFTIKTEQPDELVPLRTSLQLNEKLVKQDGNAMVFHPNPTYGTISKCVQSFNVKMEHPNESPSFSMKTERLDELLSHGSSLQLDEGIVEKLVGQDNKTVEFNLTYEAINGYVQETTQRVSIKTEQSDEFQNFSIKSEHLDESIPHGTSLQPGEGIAETSVQQDNKATEFRLSYETTNGYVQETAQGVSIKVEQPDEFHSFNIKMEQPNEFQSLS